MLTPQYLKTCPNIRVARTVVVLVLYSGVLTLTFWFSFLLRFEFSIPADELRVLKTTSMWLIPLKLAVLLSIGQFAGLLSFFSIPDLRRLFYGLLGPTLLLLGFWYWQGGASLPPRSVIVADFLLGFLGLSAIRLGFRTLREGVRSPQGEVKRKAQRVGIIGAGHVGAALAKDLITKHGLGMQPVAFFDDNPRKWRSRIHNITVMGPPEIIATENEALRLDKVVIAMPSAPAKRIRTIIKGLQSLQIRFATVPSLDQMATGRVVSQLREVAIEDLLGRQPVRLDKKNIRRYLENRVVMVTGAGGSIGQELCRQIAAFGPKQLLMLEQSEVQLFQIEQSMIESGHSGLIKPLIGDILDGPRMHHLFREFSPAVVFHAAAHKHVPMMESQPTEAVKNNTFGTVQLAHLASKSEVERFIFISTDKAINPTSIMGASKRLAELYIQSLQTRKPDGTRFMAVRFGNVLGSSGSVIPIFKRQIMAGGPIKVTHPEVTRYFMTIPEATGLVLQSGAQGKGGEIFVLDMGEPIKIADLARTMIELSGLKPGHDIEIQFVGLRPGEKLFEEVRHGSENLVPTDHDKILRFAAKPVPFSHLQSFMNRLEESVAELTENELKLFIKQMVPEYNPELQIVRSIKPKPVEEELDLAPETLHGQAA